MVFDYIGIPVVAKLLPYSLDLVDQLTWDSSYVKKIDLGVALTGIF